MNLGSVMMFVPDLAEAKRFYCEMLRFRLKGESNGRLDFVHEGCDFIAFKCERTALVADYSQVAPSVFVFGVVGYNAYRATSEGRALPPWTTCCESRQPIRGVRRSVRNRPRDSREEIAG